MLDDTVDQFRGREAEWAVLCALDGIEAEGIFPSPAQANEFIDSVWEFVCETCNEAGAKIPEKSEVIELLKKRLIDRQQSA